MNEKTGGIGNFLIQAFSRGMRIAPHGKHSRGHRKPKNYGVKMKARRRMAAKSRARNFHS